MMGDTRSIWRGGGNTMDDEEWEFDDTNLEEAGILHEAKTDVAKRRADNVQEGSLQHLQILLI